MDLRTKLIFAFVLTALAGMFLLGTFSYLESATMLKAATTRQLEALASARAGDLRVIAEAVREEVDLIRSRTNLRQQVAAYPEDPGPARAEIQRIVDDANQSVDIITRITVHDLGGSVIAQAGRSPRGDRLLGTVPSDRGMVTSFFERRDGLIDAVLEAPLEIDGRTVGSLSTEVAVGNLVDIAGNYEGLGETGEMLLVLELTPGHVTFLNALRHGASDTLVVLPLADASEPVRMALAGEDGFLEDVPDYRGVPVWAAVRGLPGLAGGLVVKVDAEEELRPVVELRGRLVRVALSAAALAILVGALVGAWLARPIRALNDVVRRVHDGDHGLRASTSGEDEVSFLAESLNRLLDDVTPTEGGS